MATYSSTSVTAQRGATVEYHSDTGSGTYAERFSYGSTSYFTIRASAATGVTTGYSTSSATFVTPPWARGLELWQNVSAVVSATSGNFTIYAEVKGADPLSGNFSALSSGGWAVGSSSGAAGYNGTTGAMCLFIYPGATNSTGRSVGAPMPQQFRVDTTLAGSSASLTFSVSGRFIP